MQLRRALLNWAVIMLTLCLSLAIADDKEDEAKEHAKARAGLAKAKISLAQAVATALKKIPGKAVEAELEVEGDRIEFEVEVVSGEKHSIVEIDAITGQVTKTGGEEDEEDDDDDEEAENAAATKAKITLSQAIETALKEVKGGKAFEAEVEMEDGKFIFEIEMLVGEKVMKAEVDAMTGKVLEVEEEKE